MAEHPVDLAFAEPTVAVGTTRAELAKGFPWTPADATEVNTTDLTGLDVREIIINAVHFVYDPTDTTSAHNGVTVLVDAGTPGKRFISEIAAGAFVNVLSIVNAPPGSPTIGDKHVVGTAPTDDFASNADDLTVFTSRGWEFASPVIGQRVFNRDVTVLKDIQWTAAGTWAVADLTAASVTPTEMKWPWGASAESEVDRPPAGQIAQGTGSAQGDLTANGGLAAAFDGTDSQNAAASAGKGAATAGFIGKDYTGAKKRVAYGQIVPSSDNGFVSAGAASVTIELRAKDGTAPVTGAEGTLLGSAGPFADVTTETSIGSNDAVTQWDHIWFRLIPDTSGDIHVAEAKFFETSSVAAGTLYIVAVNGIGPYAAQDTKVAESDGSFGWTFHTPYQGALVFDKAEDRRKEFSGTAWRAASGNFIVKATLYEADATYTKPAGLFGIKVYMKAGGGGGFDSVGGGSATAGEDSSFDTRIVAGGGDRGTISSGGAAGVASGPDLEIGRTGTPGVDPITGGTSAVSAVYQEKDDQPGSGDGGDGANTGAGGGPGAYAEGWVDPSDIAASVPVTVGMGGSGNPGGSAGSRGFVYIEEYIRA